MSRKKRKYHKRHKPLIGFKLKQQTVYTVAAIWLWIFAATVMLSFFGDGVLLIKIRDELYGYIGWVYYFLPPFFISLSFLLFKIKHDIGKPNVPGGIAIGMIALTGLFRTGKIGEALWHNAMIAISAEGAVLLFLGFLAIGLIVLFNASLDNLVNFLLSLISGLKQKSGERTIYDKNGKILFKSDKSKLTIKGSSDEKPLIKAPLPILTSKTNTPAQPSPGTAQTQGAKDMKSGLGIVTPGLVPGEEQIIWQLPPISLLSDGPKHKADRGDVRTNAGIIENTLESFGINAGVAEVNEGPAVTQYALRIALGTKVSKITSLSSDLALALAAPTGQVRIEAPIPGRDLVGIEIPNRGLEFVTLKRMLQSEEMSKAKSKLSVSLGLDVSGKAVIADIGKMPHVLVAGTTGSGKSVLINAWICSLLFRTTPNEVRFIMVDPKRVELTGYNGIPHLLTPVIVEPDKILSALRWAMTEMERRYKQFADFGVRNIDGFNEKSGIQLMPYIIILIDELADLMAYAPVEVEDGICRLAQMARATGIHLVLATQRPSVDVITGLIKANIPTRIAFNVSSMVDSRVIIDMPGAEKLLGRGDMLFIPPDQSKPSRIQGTYVSESEVNKIVQFMKEKNTPVEYTEEVLTQPLTSWKRGAAGGPGGGGGGPEAKDPLFEEAIRLICQHEKASASLLQRRLSVGYARAARMLDQLEEAGVIGPGEGSKPRDVLVKSVEDYYARQNQEGTNASE